MALFPRTTLLPTGCPVHSNPHHTNPRQDALRRVFVPRVMESINDLDAFYSGGGAHAEPD